MNQGKQKNVVLSLGQLSQVNFFLDLRVNFKERFKVQLHFLAFQTTVEMRSLGRKIREIVAGDKVLS